MKCDHIPQNMINLNGVCVAVFCFPTPRTPTPFFYCNKYPILSASLLTPKLCVQL